MDNLILYSRELDLSKDKTHDIALYFENQLLIVQLSTSDSPYQNSIGKLFVVPFVPGFGDVRGETIDITEGFTLIPKPEIVAQYRLSFLAYQKTNKVSLRIYSADHLLTTTP